MATQNTITVGVNVTDNGTTGKRIADAKQLKKAYDDAATSAAKIGGTAGSRKFAAAGYSPSSGATMSEQTYGNLRGAAGATGASARDFANQAQGLGGVVRLYATWAANIYAVGAAFSALREAASVTNMIEGMNQLGVASGVALGSMAKRFADASGGAISLQEAISATVKATSSGLSQQQFQQLGDVANKASRALGISMSDAVSRLTRGITKLEPELLDELGLFTKVGQASEEYAKRVGKSATSLTDFEKRQAFANAVLKEGIDKFGDINVKANPYDQLSASIKNLTQTALELVNKVLGPLIGFLSASPTALTAVMLGLGTMLVKQAIPAIGQYRQSLAESADFAAKKWQKRSEEMRKTELDNYKYLTNMSEAEAEKRVAILESVNTRVEKIRAKSSTAGLTSRAQEILAKTDFRTVTEEDRKYLRDVAKIEKQAGNKELAKAYNEANTALRKWIEAEQQHLVLLKQVDEQVAKNVAGASKVSPVGFARDQAEKARRTASRTSLVSKAAQDASMLGMFTAWDKLSAGVEKQKLPGLSGAFTKLTGGIAIAATGFTKFITVISNGLATIGIAVSLITGLYSLLSRNTEASDKLTSSTGLLSETLQTSSETFRRFGQALEPSKLEATSNAMAGLSDSVTAVIDDLVKFNAATRGIDQVWETLKGIFGFSKQDTAATAMANSISTMLDNLKDPEVKGKFESQLKDLLSVSDVSLASLDNALESIEPKKLEKLKPILEQIGTSSKATAATVKTVADSFKEVDSATTGLNNALKVSSPIGTYADAIAKQAKTLGEAFKDPTTAASSMLEILKDTSRLAGFPPELQSSILSSAQGFKTLSEAAKVSQAELVAVNDELFKLTGLKDSASLKQLADKLNKDLNLSIEDLNLSALLNKRFKLDADVTEFNNKIRNSAKDFANIAAKQMQFAIELALQKSGTAAAQASIDQQKTLLGFLPKSEGTIKLQMELENKSIDIRIKEITAIYELSNTLKLKIAEDKLAELEKKKEALPAGSRGYEQEIYKVKQDIQLYSSKNVAADIKAGTFKGMDQKAVYDQLTKQQGFSEQLTQLLGQKQNNRIKAAVEIYLESIDSAARANTRRLEEEKKLYENTIASQGYLNSSLEERIKIENDYIEKTKFMRIGQAMQPDQRVLEGIAKTIEESPKDSAIRKEAEASLKTYTDIFTQKYKGLLVDEDTAKKIKARTDAEKLLAKDIDSQLKPLERKEQLDALINEGIQQQLEYEKNLLSAQIERSGITTESQAQLLRDIDLEIIAKQKRAALDAEETRHLKALIPLRAQLIAIANGTSTLSKEQQDDLTAQVTAENTLYTTKVDNLNKYFDGMTRVRQMQLDEGTRIKGYGEIFQKTFEGMNDAILEFVKTGKLNFSSLISSMIEDIIRLELRMATTKLWQGMKPGLDSLLGNLFGGKSLGGGVPEGLSPEVMALAGYAKGGAFTEGVQAFAKGGTFTNAIVNTPTLFKFAQGTGLMGEAGPEAIMPLKRDSNGNLGVRASQQQGNVEVVVNNFSNAQAQTKETQDSRGNRRIEVVIGEAAAGEMARPGSSAQGAMRSTYGMSPQLIRR